MNRRVPAHVRKLIKARQSIRIDIGCGANKHPGADVVGLDIRKLPGVDIVHDLINETPWPLPANCARFAVMSHFWEHVYPWRTLPLMAELHRIMQHDGQVLIAAPHGVGFRYIQDPTHCNPSNKATFAYWDRSHPSRLWDVYQPPCFHLEEFNIIPAGISTDFNAILRVCKAESAETCPHKTIYGEL